MPANFEDLLAVVGNAELGKPGVQRQSEWFAEINEEKAAPKLAEMLLFTLDLQDAHQVGGAGYPVCDTTDGFRSVQFLLGIGMMQRCDPRV